MKFHDSFTCEMEKSFTEFLLSQNYPLQRPLYLPDFSTTGTTASLQMHPALYHWAKLLRSRPHPQLSPLALTINQPSETYFHLSPKKSPTKQASAFSPIVSPKSDFYYPSAAPWCTDDRPPLVSPVYPQDLRLQMKLQQLLTSPRYSAVSQVIPMTKDDEPEPDVNGLLDLSIKSRNSTPLKSPEHSSPTGRKRPIQDPLTLSSRKVSPMQKLDKNTELCKKSTKSPKKTKAVRRLQFDEDKSSPVSGTIIRDIKDALQEAQAREEGNKYEETALGIQVTRRGDIDPAFNTVEITEESRAEIARIENKIGAYVCRLCSDQFEDAFGLARHRCACIVHVEYKCPECEKVFSCPANLASHRRWHRPRSSSGKSSPAKAKVSKGTSATVTKEVDTKVLSSGDSLDAVAEEEDCKNNNGQKDDSYFKDSRLSECVICRKSFPHPQILQAHLATHLTPLRPSPLSLLNGSYASNTMSPSSATCPVSPVSSCSSNGSFSASSRDHESPNLDVIFCPYKCPVPFHDLAGLAHHLSSFHSAVTAAAGLLTVSQTT